MIVGVITRDNKQFDFDVVEVCMYFKIEYSKKYPTKINCLMKISASASY